MTPTCKFLVVATALLCLAAAASGGQQAQEKQVVDVDGLRQAVDASSSSEESSHPASATSRSLLGGGRGYSYGKVNRGRRFTSCSKNATVCLAKGSKGPDCCSGRCTNVKTDKINCGKCGRACGGVAGTCCNGKRVNVYTDPANCGSCGRKCLSDEYCYRGLCNYSGLD